jgi:hypothetical protein
MAINEWTCRSTCDETTEPSRIQGDRCTGSKPMSLWAQKHVQSYGKDPVCCKPSRTVSYTACVYIPRFPPRQDPRGFFWKFHSDLAVSACRFPPRWRMAIASWLVRFAFVGLCLLSRGRSGQQSSRVCPNARWFSLLRNRCRDNRCEDGRSWRPFWQKRRQSGCPGSFVIFLGWNRPKTLPGEMRRS